MTTPDLAAITSRSDRFLARLEGREDGSSALAAQLSAVDVPDLLQLIQNLAKERDEAVTEVGRKIGELTHATARLAAAEQDLATGRDVVEKARAWRHWFPSADSMFVPENALIAAVDAHEDHNTKVRFWTCPEMHPDRRDSGGYVVQSVEWRGDFAHCLEPGCGKTSAKFSCANCGPIAAADIYLLNWESPHGDERCQRCGGGDLEIPMPTETD
jgi:hypothetical protein